MTYPEPTSRDACVTVEPTTGWWTQNAAWGSQAVGNAPEGTELTPPGLGLDRAPGPPRAIAVSAHRSDRFSTGLAGTNWDLRLKVRYGAGGIFNELLTDLSASVQFTVVASSIRLSFLTYNPIPALPYDTGSSDVVVGATLGLGPTAGARAPTFTEPLVSIGASGSQSFAIPDFARAVSVFATTDDYSDFQLVFTTRGGANFGRLNFADALDAIVGRGVVIPGYAERLTISNLDPSDAANVSVIYHLGL